MIEREQKFLLDSYNFLNKEELEMEYIQQGYLMLSGDKQLRIRLVDGCEAYFCFKQDVSSTDRDEFEYAIPYEDGVVLFNSCAHKLKKRRYYVPSEDKDVKIIIDVYLHGLKVVEIEYKNELRNIPEFCGADITGINEYSNIDIAKNGWSI
jgi:adenylate cyclase